MLCARRLLMTENISWKALLLSSVPKNEMKSQKWKEISKIFNTALDIEPAKRAEYLSKACSGDERLRAEIEILLSAHEGKDSFIDSLEIGLTNNLPALNLKKGNKIGVFEIETLSEINAEVFKRFKEGV